MPGYASTKTRRATHSALAQFFLTNNILVSFSVGITVAVAALILRAQPSSGAALT